MNQKDIDKLLRARERLEIVKEYCDAQERRIKELVRDKVIKNNFDTVMLSARTKIPRHRLNNFLSGSLRLSIHEIESIQKEFRHPITMTELAARKHQPCWKGGGKRKAA